MRRKTVCSHSTEATSRLRTVTAVCKVFLFVCLMTEKKKKFTQERSYIVSVFVGVSAQVIKESLDDIMNATFLWRVSYISRFLECQTLIDYWNKKLSTHHLEMHCFSTGQLRHVLYFNRQAQKSILFSKIKASLSTKNTSQFSLEMCPRRLKVSLCTFKKMSGALLGMMSLQWTSAAIQWWVETVEKMDHMRALQTRPRCAGWVQYSPWCM